MGISMDSKYGEPDTAAPKGYFESLEIHSINTKMYQLAWDNKVQFSHDDHFYLPPNEKIFQQADAIKKDIITFINKFSNCNIWGFINPKTSLTAVLFLSYLNNPHFIILLRNPFSNAKEINNVYRIPFLKAMEIMRDVNSVIVPGYSITSNDSTYSTQR
tara:strand:- start:321 stop:797 length:477 start_codon:yes stop_codon:yes gene_type:complete